jgi:hypothetical protein
MINMFVSLLIAFHALNCFAGEGAKFTAPEGWFKTVFAIKKDGIDVLFTGRRTNEDGTVSLLMVSHSPELRERNGVRDYIGAYLDSFWNRDPQMFMAQTLTNCEVGGRQVFHIEMPGSKLRPKRENMHTYILMTEAGIYTVVYATAGEVEFELEGFLKKCLPIAAKEASFAKELSEYWIIALPKAKAQLRAKHPESRPEQRQGTNRLPSANQP